ncbi:MAG: hypothetical protein RIT27_2112 [Pseudomonadota bacterium]|jgi:hypothetical protein
MNIENKLPEEEIEMANLQAPLRYVEEAVCY